MRLSNETLGALPATVARPAYDRAAVKRGVVHLGIGAFHRAHQAAYFEAALAAGDPRWGITSVSLRSGSVRDQLGPQDCLYALVVRDGDNRTTAIVGAEQVVLVAPEDPQAVIDALAHPDVRLVTLTITEKGYKLDRAAGTLLADDPDVAADCVSLERPRTAPGFLAAGLAARRAAGLGPLTIISCDNLPHNGKLLREAVLAVARVHDPALAAWIAAEVAFPASMIDRIVPATTPDDIAALAADLGVKGHPIEDRAMVKTEPFTQWVIEDHFVTERPDFAALGVQLTTAVAPWEDAKLRLLNGAHSGIAYLGALAGDDFVHQFVATPAGRGFVAALWAEAQTTLDPPEGLNIAAYRADLMARFANSALQHRTRQIAMDGSQKLPQRLLATIAERRASGQSADALALAVAAWMRWQAGRTDAGAAFTVDDPAAAQLGALSAGAVDTAARVDALLGFFGFAADAALRDTFVSHLAMLERDGARAAVARFAS